MYTWPRLRGPALQPLTRPKWRATKRKRAADEPTWEHQRGAHQETPEPQAKVLEKGVSDESHPGSCRRPPLPVKAAGEFIGMSASETAEGFGRAQTLAPIAAWRKQPSSPSYAMIGLRGQAAADAQQAQCKGKSRGAMSPARARCPTSGGQAIRMSQVRPPEKPSKVTQTAYFGVKNRCWARRSAPRDVAWREDS